jgi:hypothetical protein
MAADIYKYPRTAHIEGSRFQPGDEDLDSVPFSEIAGRHLVIEEKVDGANSAISFEPGGRLMLQSRGHYLLGGAAEKHFDLFKQWAGSISGALFDILGSGYVLYGEWLYAKHTLFYDHLPHYFLEFDLLEKETGRFLDTNRRREMLSGLPIISAPVLFTGVLPSLKALKRLLRTSNYIQPGHLERLRRCCEQRRLDPERAIRETDGSTDMEGLYIKVEEEGVVKDRFKYVRASFLTAVENASGHWLSRPVIPNLLRPGVDLFG